MIRPTHFGSNPQTFDSNSFQSELKPEEQRIIQELAVKEWETFVQTLRENGVRVSEFDDHDEPMSPDSVFPNNWISFHEGKKMVTYPMYAPNRRLERRADIIEHFQSEYTYELLDFATEQEKAQLYLEGTGSLVLDRQNKVAYACVSPRTSPQAFDKWTQKMGYRGLIFQAVNQEGKEIYHTNVMMALGREFAIVCMEAIPDPVSREALTQSLKESHHKLIAITLEQMASFAGNMLEIENEEGEALLVMSRQAHESLTNIQLNELEKHCQLLVVAVDELEKYSGGSVRCMMAEIFD
ncbi:MAG: arginine deiminase-related protein [Bacteroidia bacterium]|nr:arginine deiminase-related protein [Bacteroidia bacterium]